MKGKRQMIRTVNDFVAAMGGTRKTAEWAVASDCTVSNWMARGHLPTGFHMRALLEINRRGLTVSPEFFGVEGKEYAELLAKLNPPSMSERISA